MSKKNSKKEVAAQAPAADTVARAAQLLESGHLTQAESVCRAILGTNPDDPDVLHVLGLVLVRRGETAAAEEQLE